MPEGAIAPTALPCAIWLVACLSLAGVAHVVWLGSRLSKPFALPIDRGARVGGHRIFGDNKTWRGLMAMPLATALAFALAALVRDATPAWLASGLWPLPPAQMATVGAGITALLAFGFVIWLSGRSVAKPLLSATQMMNEISSGDGDLDVALDDAGKDEVAQLARGFNAFVGTIRSMVQQIKQSSGSINHVADELAGTAATTNERIALQQSATAQIATAMTEMSSTVQEVAARTAEVAGTAERTLSAVTDGNRLCAHRRPQAAGHGDRGQGHRRNGRR